jgi:hypothetical protein
MKAWLHAENRARESAFPFHIVFNRHEAIELTENNAHEVLRAAESSFSNYRWEMVKLRDSIYIRRHQEVAHTGHTGKNIGRPSAETEGVFAPDSSQGLLRAISEFGLGTSRRPSKGHPARENCRVG